MNISIIIPLGPNEALKPDIVEDLTVAPAGTEIIFVAVEGSEQPDWMSSIPLHLTHLRWYWLQATKGRATQLNCGADFATGEYLWFLHADSRLTKANVNALQQALLTAPDHLYYFDLYFIDKDRRRLAINEWGAKFRSDVLGVPFGDQGLCIAWRNFHGLGGYRTELAFGEDHALVWDARFAGIKTYPCGVKLATSACKYKQYGWGRLTAKYQLMWLKQAYELLCEYRKNR